MNDTIIFTDGSSRGNPGPGGWGAIIASAERVRELGGREDHTTNNRMELTAALMALTEVLQQTGAKVYAHKQVQIYSDSRYVIRGITEWVRGWKLKGWIGATKKPVENRDLWEALLDMVEALDAEGVVLAWNYVGGHVGIAANERVDIIATEFADKKSVELFDGTRKEYSVSLNPEGHPKEKADRSAAKARARQKAFSYVSAVDGKVEVHATWEACEARVKGVKGAKYKKALNAAEEKELVILWGGNSRL